MKNNMWRGFLLKAACMSVVIMWSFPHPADCGTFYYKRNEKGTFHFSSERQESGFLAYRWFGNLDLSKEQIEHLADRYGRTHGVDARLVRAVIEVESDYDNTTVSSAGAEGLMQIMPETQRDLGVQDPFDPEENVDAGVRYLRMMLDRFQSVRLALAAYNAGPGAVEKYGGIPPFAETRKYVTKVLARYNRIKAK